MGYTIAQGSVANLVKDIASKKFKGVYYRELNGGDRSYFLIIRIEGKQKRISIGKKSEGITEAFCFQQKVKIINTEKFGEGQAEILQRVKKTDPTFRELAEHYFKHGRSRSSTKRVMGYMLKILPFADKRRVTESDITNWVTDYSKTVKPGTINNKINLIRVIFNHAIDCNLYRHDNPILKVKKLQVDDKRMRWLNRDEVKKLLDNVRDNDKLYLFTKLALCTGARISTLMLIHSDDIKGDNVKLTNIKTNQRYIGFIDKETQALIKGRKGYLLSLDDPRRAPDAYQYQYLMQKILNRLFNEGVTDRLERVVIHTLRHTTASLLVQNGTPLHVVQKVLDHKTIKSTERYAKLHQDNIKNEIHRLWD
jgi:integrase